MPATFQASPTERRISAILGPTNTGKTHLAMERMLGHTSGMIGFPLRLLARENYDRAVKAKGLGQVALITGEEKIIPAGARYFLCTVESMPLSRQVAFVGVDEIQLCADPDRGHIFTDRLLHARGTHETMFMGADTIRPVIAALVPDCRFDQRERFSTLRYVGEKKVTRLKARSAVVSFSASDVYATAELVRRQRGGTAVVLGALSPRTRNAQVALYQSGEVDYLVATDAIGMGLNMDVDHVAFAATRKFDGRMMRQLTAPEMAQIAGRAGRHMNDGTFGTTGDIGPLDPELVGRIESHAFDPLRYVYWRNPKLEMRSVGSLIQSLKVRPESRALRLAREADDERVLLKLAEDKAMRDRAGSPDRVKLLWEVCRVPDFSRTFSGQHAQLLGRIFGFLTDTEARIPTDWVAKQVARIDRLDGDIDTLMVRIAQVRTWTYVSFQANWLEDAAHWRERTRDLEDRLSDALHEKLTQRFVDKRTAHLLKRLKTRDSMNASVSDEGSVEVEGHAVGQLEGFRFAADTIGRDPAAKAVSAASNQALQSEIANRVARLEADDALLFRLAANGRMLWRGEAVAQLVKGADALSPQVDVLTSDLLDADQRERIRAKLAAWLAAYIKERLEPLINAQTAELPAPARGIVFQLTETLGAIDRRRVEEQVQALPREDRRPLRAVGVRIGRGAVFMPVLLKPAAIELRAILWAVWNGIDQPPQVPTAGRTSVPNDKTIPRQFYEACGYIPMGPLAVRLDMLERIADLAWAALESGPFEISPDMLSLAGCGSEDMIEILKRLGFHPKTQQVTAEEAQRRKADLQAKAEAKAKAKSDAKAAAKAEPTEVSTVDPGPENTPEITAADGESPAEPAPESTPETAPETPPQGEAADAPAAPQESGQTEEAPDGEVEMVELITFTRAPRRRGPPPGKGGHKGGNKGGKKGKPKGAAQAKGGPAHKSGPRKPKEPAINPDSPFAKLKDMMAEKQKKS